MDLLVLHTQIAIYVGGNYSTRAPGIVIEEFDRYLGSFERHSPSVFPFRAQQTLELDEADSLSVCDALDLVADLMGFQHDRERYYAAVTFALMAGGDLIFVEDTLIKIGELARRFDVRDSVDALLVFRGDAAELFRGEDAGIEYRFHSRERGKHNVPHVHVTVRHECSASISILDGSVLSGHVPERHLRTICERIGANRGYLLQQWNAQTDGLRVDLNVGMGLRKVI